VQKLSELLQIYQNVLKSEANSLMRASQLIDEDQIDQLIKIYTFLRDSGGNLIISGVGKSGHVGVKMASTFSSLGQPSFFLHPTEALHGDLGRVTGRDAIILISKSGTTEELIKLLPYLPIEPAHIIGLLGCVNSTIGSKCSVVFDCSVEFESCINNQAPTNSSTLALAVGDALGVIYESWVGLSKEGFLQFHPAGLLGKSLSLKVKDLMIPLSECAVVAPATTLKDVLIEMTGKSYGLCFVMEDQIFKGIIVEGDIRRIFTKNDQALNLLAQDIMNTNPKACQENDLAYQALKSMEIKGKPIHVLPVISQGTVLGLIRMHDLLKEGFRS
jgi:arabinose-5-phosphate isomerase